MSEEERDDPMIRIEKKVDLICKILHGNGEVGLVAKVLWLWRIWVWVLCAGSAMMGSMLTALIFKISGL